jgi:hypothetical protein
MRRRSRLGWKRTTLSLKKLSGWWNSYPTYLRTVGVCLGVSAAATQPLKALVEREVLAGT